jgi:hypothetical protein
MSGLSGLDDRYVARARVSALYKSLLGRFPGEAETAYWSSELLDESHCLRTVIDLIAGSAECAERLRSFFRHPSSVADWRLYP